MELSFVNVGNIETLIWPDQAKEITPESPALEIFTDLKKLDHWYSIHPPKLMMLKG